jgi:two-component system sensor histidine kinase YesM
VEAMMKLRQKLFIAFVILIIIPLFLLGSITFFVSFNVIQKKYSEQTELTLKALGQNIEYVLTDMNNLSDSWIGNYYLQNILNRTTRESENLTMEDPLKIVLDERSFRSVLLHHPAISYAQMYDSTGKIIPLYSGKLIPMSYEQFQEHPIYKEVKEKDGLPVWIAPFEYPEITGTEPVLTQIRVVNDLFTLKDKGILMIQVKLSGLEKLFHPVRINQSDQNNRFLIVNPNDQIFYDSYSQIEGEYFESLLPVDSADKQTNYRSLRDQFQNRESIISIYNISDMKWKLVSIASWDSLSKEMELVKNWAIGISIFSLISALMFNLLFVNRTAKSIIRIVRLMRRVEQGELSVRAPEKGSDETLLLAKGFNSLVGTTKDLLDEVKLEQERKNTAEMMLLQAQIKPHFLFNTLESINVLAVQNEGKKVSQMVYRLGNILRISIQEKEEISIKQEIEHLKNYLEIQKYRFEDLFEFDLQVPESIIEHTIMKITLQPLVENSIQHGFDGIDRKGFIRVWAEEDSHQVIFWIEDNGVGISPSMLSRFQYQTDSCFFDEEQSRSMERKGLGVKNVADRIRIHYGAGYGLYICSELDKGTLIKCVIPKKQIG